ncbi:MAG: hypothetical protein LBQ79_12605 [Deltaproteobacteria bacterium]|jgi:hypothetical protein|nr:hypothetical protein [Deltaproteobacteria bacterium]
MITAQGIEAETIIFGRAAISLAYNDRRTTHDIDAVYDPYMTES